MSPSKWDAIVIGSRCGGAPTAMLLGRKGHRVLLLDRDVFPKDTLSTHIVRPFAVRQLRRWGLLDKVSASGCPALVKVVADYGETVLSGWVPSIDGVYENFAPRRFLLDSVLLEGALAAGVEARLGFSVREILKDGPRVYGIRGVDKQGRTVTELADVIIGADGKHSRLARTVKAPAYNTAPPLLCWYYSYWSGLPTLREPRGVWWESYYRPTNVVFVIPTNGDLACVMVGWPHSQFRRVRRNIEASYREALAQMPLLHERVRAARREDRFRGTADLPNFMRRPHGPGWALVGDAGFHKDPLLGHGILDAFRDAELLAEAVHAGLSGNAPMQVALAQYERQRNESAMGHYEYTLRMAALGPPSEQMRQLRRALKGNQEQTNRFLGISSGTTRVEDFFAEGNLQRLHA